MKDRMNSKTFSVKYCIYDLLKTDIVFVRYKSAPNDIAEYYYIGRDRDGKMFVRGH